MENDAFQPWHDAKVEKHPLHDYQDITWVDEMLLHMEAWQEEGKTWP
jgi:hypothetical protein